MFDVADRRRDGDRRGVGDGVGGLGFDGQEAVAGPALLPPGRAAGRAGGAGMGMSSGWARTQRVASSRRGGGDAGGEVGGDDLEDLVAGAGRVDVGHPLTDPGGELARADLTFDDLTGDRIREPDDQCGVVGERVAVGRAGCRARRCRTRARQPRRPTRSRIVSRVDVGLGGAGGEHRVGGCGGALGAGVRPSRLRSRTRRFENVDEDLGGDAGDLDQALAGGSPGDAELLGELMGAGRCGTRRRRCAWPGTGPGRRAPTSVRRGRG